MTYGNDPTRRRRDCANAAILRPSECFQTCSRMPAGRDSRSCSILVHAGVPILARDSQYFLERIVLGKPLNYIVVLLMSTFPEFNLILTPRRRGELEPDLLVHLDPSEWRNRLQELSRFGIWGLASSEVRLSVTHVTPDGPVTVRTYPVKPNGVESHISGATVHCQATKRTLFEANNWALKTFAQMWPNHVCSGCVPIPARCATRQRQRGAPPQAPVLKPAPLLSTWRPL